MSNGVITHLEARLLKEMVNREIHPIRCASACARKAQKALYLGNLCAEARHPVWALKIWRFTLSLIHSKDYDDWIDVWFNTKYVRLSDVISDGLCEIIGRRIDDVERSLGVSAPRGRDSWEYRAGDGFYNYLFYEKYDSDWDSVRDSCVEMRDRAVEDQLLKRFFYEVQGYQPPQAQNFFDYWNDYSPLVEEDVCFRVDDWD